MSSAEVLRGLPFADYLAIDAVNQSRLRPFAKSLRAGVWAEEHPTESTPAMEFGTAVHTWNLDGEEAFAAAYSVGGPVNPKTGETFGRNTKAFAEWLAEQPKGRPFISPEDLDRVKAIAAAINGHRWAAPVMRDPDAVRELTIVWTEHVHGEAIRCKARLDFYHHDHGVIDLKTTADITTFPRSVANFEYHTQAAWYLRAASAAGLDTTKYGWLAVEATPPHELSMARAPAFLLECGRVRAEKALKRYANWQTGLFELSDGDEGWTDVELPRWAWESEQDMNALEVL